MAVTYFGQNDNGDGSAGRAIDYLRGCRFENTAGTGNLAELGINLVESKTGKILLAVYADTGSTSQPGARLLDAGELTNPGAGWNSITGLTLAVTEGTYYWLVWNNSTSPTVYHNTAHSFSYRAWTYADGMPDPFGTIGGTQTPRTSIRAGVELAGAALLKIINE